MLGKNIFILSDPYFNSLQHENIQKLRKVLNIKGFRRFLDINIKKSMYHNIQSLVYNVFAYLLCYCFCIQLHTR